MQFLSYIYNKKEECKDQEPIQSSTIPYGKVTDTEEKHHLQ